MNLKISQLNKSYGKVQAVHDLSLSMNNGIYALLGPNGAGKSTLMNILTLNIREDSGRITADGRDIRSLGKTYLKKLAYMPQQQFLPGYFTCVGFLSYIAALKEMDQKDADERIENALHKVNLWDKRNARVRGLSGGMKQRLLIAQAILDQPDLIILDEPTAGLDPQERIRIRNLIGSLNRDRIILIATHVVQDIECISDHVLFMYAGRIINDVTPDDLPEKMPCAVFEAVLPSGSPLLQESSLQISMMNREQGGMRVRVLAEKPPFPQAVRKEPNLEDMYLALFGRDEV